VAVGYGERAEWSGNGDITEDKPVCTLTIAFPSTILVPRPLHTASALARGILAPFLNPYIIRRARVQLRFWCSYVIDCKDDCQGPVPVQIVGAISGLEQVQGQGRARADVRVVLDVDPFNQFQLAPGPLLGVNYTAPFRLGGQVALQFNDADVVACGEPQDIAGEVLVEADADFAATALADVDQLSFTISAPDPPGEARIRLLEPVSTSIMPEQPPPAPKAARGFALVPLPLPPGRRLICSVAAEEQALVVAAARDTEEAEDTPELFRLQLSTQRYSRPLRPDVRTWGRLRRLPWPSAEDDSIYAFDLGPLRRETGVPRRRGARLVRVDRRGRVDVVARGLDVPSDAAVVVDGDTTLLVVSEMTSGRISAVSPRGRRRAALGGLEFPVALAATPPGSPWQAPLYVAEAGPVRSEAFAPGQGRIRAILLREQETSVVTSDVGVAAMAISPGGLFGEDLLVATANAWTGEREPVPGSGRVLRLTPTGTVTPIVTAIDDPLEVCFSPSGRCFVLAGAGLFELVSR
jgi:hypothetical protein